MSIHRHDLCFLKKNVYPLEPICQDTRVLFDYWISKDYPFIVPRQPSSFEPSLLQLAIPYVHQRTGEKIRSSVCIHACDVMGTRTLPTINDVFGRKDLIDCPLIQVFGSYAWQFLTKELYINASSDLDLLIIYQHHSLEDLQKCVHQLMAVLTIKRIDAEVRFNDHGDCALAELLDERSPTILFKSFKGLELKRRDLLYAKFPALLC